MEQNRILITSLGNSVRLNEKDLPKGPYNYQKVLYKFEKDKIEIESPFTLEALVIKEPFDHIFIVGTIKSCWAQLYWYFDEKCEAGIYDMDYEVELESISENNGYNSDPQVLNNFPSELLEKTLSTCLKVQVHIILIHYGITKNEMEENYNKLKSIELVFKPKILNELFVDITHSFRSLPLYQFLFVEFYSRLSDYMVELKKMYYGMLDVINELYYAPIVELDAVLELSRWINSVSEMNNHGSVYQIVNQIHEDNELSKWLEIFEWSVNTNDYDLLMKAIVKIKGYDLKDLKEVSPQGLELLSKLQNDLSKRYLNQEDDMQIGRMQFSLGCWYLDQRRYGLAALTFQETLKSIIVIILKRKPAYKDKEIWDEEFRNGAFREFVDKTADVAEFKKIYNIYKIVKPLRNKFAHNILSTEEKVDVSMNEIHETIELIHEYKEILNDFINNMELQNKLLEDMDRKVSLGDDIEYIFYLGQLSSDAKKNNVKGCYKKAKEIEVSSEINKLYDRKNENEKERKSSIKQIKNYVESILKEKENVLFVLGNTEYIKQNELITWFREKEQRIYLYHYINGGYISLHNIK